MIDADIRLELAATAYRPGDELAGAFVIAGGPPPDTRSVEFSVLWHTSGRGTEDIGVISFQAWKADDETLAALPNPHTFAVRLPRTPWSYDGELIQVHWLARVRVRYRELGHIQEVIRDAEFTLAPAART